MALCHGREDNKDADEEKEEKPLEGNDKILTVLEALLASMDHKQIFNLL